MLRTLLCFLTLVVAAHGDWVQTFSVGQAFGDATAGSAASSDVTSGDLIACGIGYWPKTISITSVADTRSTTYTQSPASVTEGGYGYAAMYYGVLGSSGPNTVTVTMSAAANYLGIVCKQLNGQATSSPLDQSAMGYQAAPGTGTDAVASPSVTTTVGNTYLFGLTYNDGLDGGAVSAGTNWSGLGGNTSIGVEHRTLSSAGSVQATFTVASGTQYLTGIMAFKPADASSGTVRRRVMSSQ